MNSDGKRDKLKPWRTVSSAPPWVFGWAGGAISGAAHATDPPRVFWKLEGDDPPDALRAVTLGEEGGVIAFRRRGGIFLGSLGKSGVASGELVQVAGAGAPPGSPVGAPVLASNGSALAVAFADRASPAEPWAVRVGAAAKGSLPAATSAFAVPPGGPGGAALAPALAGLSDGRWLLVWTEGSGGSHDVRAQTLSAELGPVGEPFTVSLPGANAGQGAAAVASGQGVVAYLSLTEHGYEVWGSAIDCR